nr:MAG TPA: hypothetical protein [Caudoviricetes sp.]
MSSVVFFGMIDPVMSGHNWHCTNRRLSLNDN